ncbi:hypothetical protein Aph02nite_25430 [Actinoplanes philippinensis]|uniref:Uncharacterized protein n=1 Tax=Actinoplanes philippinensis TaxID=35752 RepID=A0A1I2G6K9_9ACTN|nr:hypothetical protein [Actinoplanes philippinensis]GIE76593.1 hypothetical protein Aph02nite_25430 [Actinoplanes philippinensis]SFF12251.1 hypothetical protein SAMN05421541_106200 [Actinoplanes philippinensis]
MRDVWPAALAAAFSALRGRSIEAWQGVEMSVRGGDEGVPEYATEPCLQLFLLEMVCASGPAVTIGTCQDDLGFGLRAEPGTIRAGDDWGRGFRRRTLTELPTGLVQDVEVYRDGDVLAEVRIRFAERELLLMAGESDEGWAGELTWRRLDESVLVFTDPGEAERVSWMPSRGPLHRM